MLEDKLKLLLDTNTLESDYRAEVLVAGLLEAGQDENRMLIVRQDAKRKDVAKDISRINKEFSGLDLVEYLHIYTNRYGIYDSLPEGLFHQSLNRRRRKTQQDVIDEMREHRIGEFHVRRFFQPFEMAIDQVLIDTQLYEKKFDKAYAYENLKLIFEEHWDILEYLSLKQTLLFIKLIPLIPEAGRSFELMASVMSVILDCPVKIKEGRKSQMEVAEEECISLNKMKLGVNSVIGKTVQNDFADLDIILGPTDAKRVKEFQTSLNHQVILQKLIDLIIPFDRNTNIRYEVFKEEMKFRLSDKYNKAYLGVNTTL